MTRRGGVLTVVLVAVLHTVPAAAQTIEDTSVSTGDNSNVNAGGTQIINQFTRSEYEQQLRERLFRITDELLEEKDNSRSLILEKSEIERRLANLESSYDEKVEQLRDLRAKLSDLAGGIEQKRIDAAKQALFEGDSSKADALFAEVEAMEQESIDRAADAAFQRGRIAEDEIRWADAADHYARAERLAPTTNRLRKAREFALMAGRYHQALRHFEDHLREMLARHGEQSREYADALNYSAVNLIHTGRFAEGERRITLSIAIDREHFGTDSMGFALKLNTFGALLRETERFAEAEVAYRDSMAIFDARNQRYHVGYPLVLNGLALVLRDLGRYGDAESVFRRALEASLKRFGDKHPHHSLLLHNRSILLRDMQRYESAEAASRKALEIYRQTIGDQHPNYGRSIGVLGSTLTRMGRLAEAEPMLLTALEIDEATVGRRHPVYTIHLDYLGDLQRRAGRLDEAEATMREAIERDRSGGREARPDFARHLLTLARVLMDLDRTDEAAPLLAEAFAVVRAALGVQHPTTREIAVDHARLLATHRPQDPALADLIATFGPDIGTSP